MEIIVHSDEDKSKCVDEYINGADKYYLSGKYSVSIRTIDRWISKMNIDEIQLRIARRANTIPIDIQKEILKLLNTNPILCGFNSSEWNEITVIKYINNKYGIEINRRMAKALIEDAKKINPIKYEDRIYNDIAELDALGYSIVLLDYIKIGRIDTIEVEALELRKYTENKLDVNLVIARASDSIYLDIILSEINIVDKRGIVVTKVSEKKCVYKEKLQRRVISDDKYEVLKKIKIAEDKENIIFITTYDKDITKLKKKRSNIKYFIVGDAIYIELLQEKYEDEDGKSVVDYMYDENNRNRKYGSIRNISQVVWGKIDAYVLKVTNDKFNIIKDAGNDKNIIFNMEKNREKMRKTIKILNSNFIHNI
ncbi:MAG: hypothetical protein E7215_10340 [Clostridium sulfidigenes]|uniref:Uncharacterized protein n=1 Tax=Clostridium sulfidigenes TaxID=318464 RepID=A0A927ZJ93_9CLOT|nr:hypothetical protein [Clostridium sulfidigenes]